MFFLTCKLIFQPSKMDIIEINSSNSIFFLGGHDLEMLEIKKILIDKGFVENETFFDKSLEWDNAHLIEYKDVLEKFGGNNEVKIYGVELSENKPIKNEKSNSEELKIDIPSNYKRIDHHNNYSHEDSSIEQIVKLLKMELNDEQKLIAEDDKFGLLGLKKMGKDRDTAQKFFEKKSNKYQNNLKNAKDLIGSIKTDNCTVLTKDGDYPDFLITDQYYLKHWDKIEEIKDLIILDKDENVFWYYGKNRAYIFENFKEYKLETISEKGAENGLNSYFGVSKGIIETKKINITVKDLLQQIVDFLNKDLHSQHIFSFVFNWEFTNNDKTELIFSEKTKLENFNFNIDKKAWKGIDEQELKATNYNKKNYFYDFTLGKSSESEYSKKYEYITTRELAYHFKIKDKKRANDSSFDEISYSLSINSIKLIVFDSGVGILQFLLSNYKYKTEADILRINNFGRRLYPQYIDDDMNFITIRDRFLPIETKIEGIDESTEDFTNFGKALDRPLPKFIDVLLPKISYNNKKTEYKYFSDAMFVGCWYNFKNLKTDFDKNSGKYDFENFKNESEIEKWNQFIFLDSENDPNSNNPVWRAKENIYHTYGRWAGATSPTLYGISQYSFVCLSNDKTFIRKHVTNQYNELVIQALSEKASILRFYEEITKLSIKVFDKDLEEAQKSITEIKGIHKSFLEFKNRGFHIPLTFSTQIQGIELHQKIVDIFRIKPALENLETTIKQVSDGANLFYSELIQKQNEQQRIEQENLRRAIEERNKIQEANEKAKKVEIETQKEIESQANQQLSNTLAILGAAFAIPSFVISYFGYSFFDLNKLDRNKEELFRAILFVMIICVFTFILLGLKLFNKKKESSNTTSKKPYINIIGYCSGVILLISILFYPPVKSYINFKENKNNNENITKSDSTSIKKILKLKMELDSLKRLKPTIFVSDSTKRKP